MKQLIRLLAIDVKRAFGSFNFFLAIAGIWIVYYAGARDAMYDSAYVLLLFRYATEASGFNSILFLFCVLPYTTSFCSDWNSKFIRQVVGRAGIHKYALSKVISCAISAGAAATLGILFFLLSCAIKFPLVSPSGNTYENFVTTTLGGELLQSGHYAAYFAIYIYLVCLAGAFWSVVGLCSSAYITNKFVALFTPFIGIYVLSYATYKLPVWLRLNKVTWGEYEIGGVFTSLLYATSFVALLLAAVGFLFFKTAEKRLANE